MNKCETCFHRAVCYVPELERNFRGKVIFTPCNNYAPEGKLIAVDEDMALALCAGAAASENMARRVFLFEVGGSDQRTIPFHDAARALRKAGEMGLRRGCCL